MLCRRNALAAYCKRAQIVGSSIVLLQLISWEQNHFIFKYRQPALVGRRGDTRMELFCPEAIAPVLWRP
jgi:hypothetical protein